MFMALTPRQIHDAVYSLRARDIIDGVAPMPMPPLIASVPAPQRPAPRPPLPPGGHRLVLPD